MTQADDDPHCPECGGPIGQTATYCMHCSADLTAELAADDSDDDGRWDEGSSPSSGGGFLDGLDLGAFGSASGETGDAGTVETGPTESAGTGTTDGAGETADADQYLDPDGLVDNTLTVVVGILAGLVVGFVGTFAIVFLTGSLWGFLIGVVVWLGSTAFLVRRRTVQGAISRGAYAVAAILLLFPFVALSPSISAEGGIAGRVGGFLVLLLFAGVPAAVALVVGFVASRFVPDGPGTEG